MDPDVVADPFISSVPEPHMSPSVVYADGREQQKWTAADAHNACVDLSHRGLKMATSKVDIPTNFNKLGSISPCDVQLRVPYTPPPPVAPHGAIAQPAAGLHQTKNDKLLACQQGPVGAEIAILGPWGWLRVLILD